MRLYLIRHAESVWNAEDRVQGHGDSPLTDAGLAQAERLGRRLASCKIGELYASPLQRALQTAQAVSRMVRVPVVTRSALREIFLGAWEGKTPAEVNAGFQNGFELWSRRPTAVTIPDSEPIDRFRTRAIHAIDQIMRQADDRARVPAADGRAQGVSIDESRSTAVAVVTHGGVIAAYLAHVLGADFDFLLRRLHINNTGVTIFEALDAEHPAILAVNDLQHLNHHATSA